MARKPKAIVAYKAFDKNFKCRDLQYEVGKTYEHSGKVEACKSGFHACESPLDVLNYYPLLDSKFAQVEVSGDISRHGEDSKIAAAKITIVAELTLPEFINQAVDAVIQHCKKAKKNIASGNYSTAASSGNYSTAASSGNYSTAACDTNGFACVAGLGGYAKGNAGSAISVGYRDAGGKNRISVGYVGEDGILADTWYRANEAGKLIAV